MVQVPQRTAVRGPTFIRLLARLTDVDVPASRQSLPDRLSQWLDWSHAIALSTALDGRPSGDGLDGPSFGSEEEEECARIRGSLAQAIAGDPVLAVGDAEEGAADAVPDYAVFRQRYLTLQRRMQAGTGHLRGRLRDMLARQSVELARLAEVDSVMELALSPREQMLLAAVPALLGEHFERLRVASSGEASTASASAWLSGFRKDMQSVLLAELDVRFQPVEGLLAALRAR
ncbi:DUF3348 domain-containing protein [Dyella japonica]|uniref:DUF3348 domain-containing protein n=1 Tax=Dyella japonica A8 TaxID=1217721 RepID=A0A075K3K0_9GAMM|nr:DUF3348 domain-containing protein [Dyella japonica]AIF48801.1 hypothetical protein HY57_16900 [Dyella japonica A8]